MSIASPAKQSEWLSSDEVEREFEIPPESLTRLAKANLVARRCIPHTRPRYLRSSLEALVARYTQEAANTEESTPADEPAA